jgi:hypothetical protein
MGEFTQNLLKLTEFPFSYSLMGLLALIFGQSTSAGEEFSFVRISPLLILTGFVATTLSICDCDFEGIGSLEVSQTYPCSTTEQGGGDGDIWIDCDFEGIGELEVETEGTPSNGPPED